MVKLFRCVSDYGQRIKMASRLSAVRMRLEPFLKAGDGTEGLGVDLISDRLPVDGRAVC